MKARSLLIALAFVAATPAAGQSPGSVESELKYAREYMEAGNWQYAIWRFEAVLERDPRNAEALSGLARAKAAYEAKLAPGALTNAPEPQPVVEETAPAAFAVGDYVEFDRFSDGTWGRFGRVTELNGNPASACPSYFVEEAGGGLTLSFVCNRVRPASPAQLAAAGRDASAGAKGAPPLGDYFCTYGLNRPQVLGPGRNFKLLGGGRYSADDGAQGTYKYDRGSGRLTFSGGYFGRMKAQGEFKGGKSNQIDISPEGGVITFCSLQ